MNIKRSLFLLITTLALFAPLTLFAAGVSAGVPNEGIWFSKDPFFAGEQITVFAPLYNSSPYRFGGSVTLRDGTTVIGVQTFMLDPGGAGAIYAFPWKATQGAHAFSVEISSGEFFSGDKSTTQFSISQTTDSALKRFVDVQATPSSSATTTPTTEILSVEESPVTNYLSTKIPATIASKALPIVGSVEQFRVNQANRANAMEHDIVTGITEGDSSAASTSGWGVFTDGVVKGGIIHTPWEYVKLFFALCYQFITTNIYVFYILLSYILYRIIRAIVRIFS